MRFQRHQAFLDSLLEQADYLRLHASIEVSERLIDSANETLGWLTEHEGVGFLWPDPRVEGIRYWPVRGFPNHRIMYRSASNGVEGLLVFHAARGPNLLFPPIDAEPWNGES